MYDWNGNKRMILSKIVPSFIILMICGIYTMYYFVYCLADKIYFW
jgi:hypothetical protein